MPSGIPSCGSWAVLNKLVVTDVGVVLMTELNRSDITPWFPWPTNLVGFRKYATVRGINRRTLSPSGRKRRFAALQTRGGDKSRGLQDANRAPKSRHDCAYFPILFSVKLRSDFDGQ